MQGTLTVRVRGRPVEIPAAELEAELSGEGPCRSLAHLEAVVCADDRARAVARLRRLIAAVEPGVQRVQAALGLVRLGAAESGDDLRALGARVGGEAGALARAAAFLVEGRAGALADALADDALLTNASPQAFVHLLRVPDDAPRLFAAWLTELEKSAHARGVTAYRALLGDVAEAAFRALQHGIDEDQLLGAGGAAFLVDAICAELPGTTDFLAARGMSWLLGTLVPADDTARSAIERARTRFRDAAFNVDCDAMLAQRGWPPPPRLR